MGKMRLSFIDMYSDLLYRKIWMYVIIWNNFIDFDTSKSCVLVLLF